MLQDIKPNIDTQNACFYKTPNVWHYCVQTDNCQKNTRALIIAQLMSVMSVTDTLLCTATIECQVHTECAMYLEWAPIKSALLFSVQRQLAMWASQSAIQFQCDFSHYKAFLRCCVSREHVIRKCGGKSKNRRRRWAESWFGGRPYAVLHSSGAKAALAATANLTRAHCIVDWIASCQCTWLFVFVCLMWHDARAEASLSTWKPSTVGTRMCKKDYWTNCY